MGNNRELIQRMTDAIIHRGPDEGDYWIADDLKVTLGHRRLAIIDLSNAGIQPMHFLDRYVITFNGEIYNYLELRDQLITKGYVFKTGTDTEVILAAFHEWSMDCLSRFDGMFALAIYDKVKKELFCARDRFGEKPFYYAFHEGNLFFASEMKALWTACIPKTPNMSMLYNFLANDLVENPNDQTETFYQGIFKLKSAHCFHYSGNETVNQKSYWHLNTNATSDLNLKAAGIRLGELLETSVKRRLRSDVPVGTSLSGGLDSSTIVAQVSGNLGANHTFSARFPGFSKDEGHFIDIVNNKFNTIHHNVVVDENELFPELDKLIFHQEEPFQTGSIFAQYCVYREARKNNVIVMLDGQGADELLGGYDKDFKFYLRELIIKGKDPEVFMKQILDNHYYRLSIDRKELLKIKTPRIYHSLAAIKKKLQNDTPLGIHPDFHRTFAPKRSPFHEFNDLKSMLRHELTNQGLEKLLRFADRNSMAHSLEVRLPFLSHDLVEFVMSLKSELFLQDGWSKAVLRESTKSLLPNEIVFRKDKIGFEAPHQQWMERDQMNVSFKEAQQQLITQKLITQDYSDRWKTVLAYRFIAS